MSVTRIFGMGLFLFQALFTAATGAVAAMDFEVRVVPAISDNYILPEDQPMTAATAADIQLAIAPNEYEPASFVVYAQGALNDLSIEAGELTSVDGDVLAGAQVDVRIVKRWYQRMFGAQQDAKNERLRMMVPELLVYDDKLVVVESGKNMVRLESGEYLEISKPGRKNGFSTPKLAAFPVRDAETLQPLNIDAGTNRQFWLTVYAPENAAPGDYTSTIYLRLAGKEISSIQLHVEVLPIQLAKPLINYSIYYRGKLDRNWQDGSVSSEYKSEAQMLDDLLNLKRHGITNPTVYQLYSSKLLPNVLSLRQAAGMDTDQIYYLGTNVVANNNGSVSPRLSIEVKDVIKAAQKQDIGAVYFYARDEARGEELTYQFPFWDVVRNAGGRIMTAGWQTDAVRPGNFDTTGGYEDLFVSLGTVRGSEAARWHSKGRKIYSYQNPTGGIELPESWRRNYGLLLWQYDYDGGMPYAWQHSYAAAWNDFDHGRHRDHNFTYPTVDSSIDTTQWEGLREGVDDVRYLTTLINLLAATAAPDSAAAGSAGQWLRELKLLPLGQQDLSALRSVTVGHILALQQNDAVAGDAVASDAPAITDLQVSPISSDGRVELSWRTASRAPSYVNVDGQLTFQPATVRKHRVEIEGVQPNKTLLAKAYSFVDEDGQAVTTDVVIDSDSKLKLSVDTSVADDQFLLTTELAGNYRTSIAIDWQNSLQGWWRFEDEQEPELDSSGYDNEGKLKGDVGVSDGWFGKGLELDGAGSFVNFPDVEIEENGAGTVEGWFRFNSFAMENLVYMGIFSGVYQHSTNNHFYFARSNEHFEVGSLLRLNTWHHIVLTWNGDSATALLYVDGQVVRPTVQGKAEEVLSIDGLNIGRHAGYLGGLVGPATNTFDGSIDEIRAWSRPISGAEVQASYQASAKASFAFPKPAKGQGDWTVLGANAANRQVRVEAPN